MKQWIFAFAAAGLVGCSSSQPIYHSETSSPMHNREAFVEYSEKQLDQWEEVLDDMEGSSRERLSPLIADLRAEVAALKNSPEERWYSYRDRIANTLTQAQDQYFMEAE